MERQLPRSPQCPRNMIIGGMSSRIIGDRVLYNWTCQLSEALKDFGRFPIPDIQDEDELSYYSTPNGLAKWYKCQESNTVMAGIIGVPPKKYKNYKEPPQYELACLKLQQKYTLANCTNVPMDGPVVNISFGSGKALLGFTVQFMSEYLAHLYSFTVCDVVSYCDISGKGITFLGHSKHLITTPYSSKSSRYWFSCVDGYTFNGTTTLFRCTKTKQYPDHYDAIETICTPTCCALDVPTLRIIICFDLFEDLTCVDNMTVVNCPKNRLLMGNKTICPYENKPNIVSGRFGELISCKPCDNINYCSNVSCNETHTFCLKCLDVHPKNGLPLILTQDGTQCVVAAHILEMKLRRLDHDTFRITCVVAGSQPIKFKWTTNTTTASLQSSEDFVIIQRLQEHAYVKCSAENEFGRQERNVSVGK